MIRFVGLLLSIACFAYTTPTTNSRVHARDLAVVPLLNGERDGLNNYWGGPFGSFRVDEIALDTNVVHSGDAAYRVDLGTLSAGNLSFFQSFSSARTGTQDRRQTRDLTRYESFEGYLRNDTNAPLNIRFEIKDYRDSNSHRASKNFTVPTGGQWTKISTSLDLANGWSIQGDPDLGRTYIASFVIDPQPTTITGSYYFDDFSFVETGGPIDSQTAPIETIVDRLAERQFSGLWTARNRVSGLIYNHKDGVNIAAMNTTGGTLWMLPAAVRRGWVSQSEADAFVAKTVTSLNTNLDQTTYVPTRFIDALTAGLPGGVNEESSIDSSFIALALHNYKTQPTTPPALAAQIDEVQNRFQLDAFAIPAGFRLAYFPATGFTPGTYNGYTNEGKVISLAAEVSDDHHVPLEDLWNSDTARSRNFLIDPADAHLTHSITNFRAPFEQALLNLYVATSNRGVDNYPNRSLATNPWQNFVRYEREVAAKLQQLGRDNFFQPDAASGAPFSDYQQYSLYNDFGQPDLFMPWSVSFAMLAGAEGANDALRALLEVDGVMGPLSLADSVRWNTGETKPYFVSNNGDNWNTVLSTMAWMELLDRLEGQQSSSAFFASLTGVSNALDEVFVDGDLSGDGITDAADLAIWQAGYGDSAGSTPANGDTDGDGDVDGADFLRWQRGYAGGVFGNSSVVPEPNMLGVLCWAILMTPALSRSRCCRRLLLAFLLLSGFAFSTCKTLQAGDLNVVPLLDGERASLLNNWGGPFNNGSIVGVTLETGIVHSGNASYRADLGTIPANEFRFFQTFSSERTSLEAARQTRKLTRYDSFEAYVRNDTNAPMSLRFELKDYRDSNNHRASQVFTIPTGATWTKIAAPLDLSTGWTVVGSPDLERTYIASFVVQSQPILVSGSLYLDDFSLIEPDGPIDPLTAPLNTIVERLAERQFDGIWSARNRTTGLIYNTSHQVGLAAMNNTAGVLWMLPAAVRRGWVGQTDADAYVGQLVGSLHTNLDATDHVPSRFYDPVTAFPNSAVDWAESSVDSAFLALALHQYKSLSTTSQTLHDAIDAVQNRFDHSAFIIPEGWSQTYSPVTGFLDNAYKGYTNESKVISLAAELSDSHHVPLEDLWNTDVLRARDFLVNADDAHIVHSWTQFRVPFEQALLNLFVDTSNRGVDNYPNRHLATNPWSNYVRYQREVAAKLEQLGRDHLFQPDAGQGGPPEFYKQYSLYNDFGQSDLFMPWSVALALLATPDEAEDALRFLLNTKVLQGPLGIADTARWTTGDGAPTIVAEWQSNWNHVLSTMALIEFLEGDASSSSFLASLTEVEEALDEVFVDGDLTGNGITDGADLAIWLEGYGDLVAATPAGGDSDGDGDADGADFLRWQRGATATVSLANDQAATIPEAATSSLVVSACMLAWSAPMRMRQRPRLTQC